jgi:hypothetical protein
LNRTRSERLDDAKFVAGMCAYRVMGHELIGNPNREQRIEAASNVDRSQFLVLSLVVSLEFCALTLEFSLFGVCLRVDRYVFTGSHRHSSCDQAGDPRDQHVAASPMRCGDTEHQTRCRNDPVVRA